MTDLPPVIILGVDTPIGLTIVRELGARGVRVHGVGRTATPIGGQSRYCKSVTRRTPGALTAQLRELIASTGAKALFAVSEDDLVAVSAIAPVLDGCALLTPRAGPLAIVLDKSETLARAALIGIDVPQSWQPVTGENFATRIMKLEFPVIAKWADPPAIVARLAALNIALLKAEYIEAPHQLVAMLNRYQHVGSFPLVQSFCPGIGLGQMFHMQNGRATLRFTHRRLHEWPPEGGISTLCAAEPLNAHMAQQAKSEALLAAIGWEGPAMVEYRYDAATGRYWLMEINGRFWGSQPLAYHNGAHFAWEHYRRAVLGQSDAAPEPAVIRRARYMIPETRRLIHIMRGVNGPSQQRRGEALLSWIAGFFDPNMRYYVFSWRDPKPFFSDIANVIRKSVRREMR